MAFCLDLQPVIRKKKEKKERKKKEKKEKEKNEFILSPNIRFLNIYWIVLQLDPLIFSKSFLSGLLLGEAARPAAAHLRLRPAQLRAGARGVPLQELPDEVHRGLRHQGERDEHPAGAPPASPLAKMKGAFFSYFSVADL